MSEPSSLYMRVHLTAEQLEAFQSSRLMAPRSYDDWQPWLDSKTFHGNITAADIQNLNPSLDAGASDVQSVGEYLSFLLEDAYASPSQANYDATTQTWTLYVMQLSENYNDFIVALSILRGIAAYKDLPGDDFIIIYPYLWAENPGAFAEAYVVVTPGSSRILNQIPADVIHEANQRLGNVLDAFRQSYADDTP